MTTIKYHLIKLLICHQTSRCLQDGITGWYFQKNDICDLFVCCLTGPDKKPEDVVVGDQIVLLAPIKDTLFGKYIVLKHSNEVLPIDEHWEEIMDVPVWVIGTYIIP